MGLLCDESLHLDLIKLQFTCCWQKQTRVCVTISRPFVSLHLFWGGEGVPKSILFSLFQNKKASFKGIYTLNDFHMRVFINTEILMRGPLTLSFIFFRHLSVCVFQGVYKHVNELDHNVTYN